jgi:ribosomal peptide maturation radical SAM protein 1
MLNVALILMPFASTRLPSIQLGLLKALAKREGHEVEVHYLNLPFARMFGWERYEALCGQGCRLLGEWLFSHAAFGSDAPPAESFLELAGSDIFKILDVTTDELLDLRTRRIPQFVETHLHSVAWDAFDIVAFTSMFEQTCASLAMARAIKTRHPRIVTLFGGANFDGEMGKAFAKSIDWIDFVIAGEAEEAFPALLKRIAEGRQVEEAPLPGVIRRIAGGVTDGGRAAMIKDMDTVPLPDYDEFFLTSARVGSPREIGGKWTFVPFESSRGCWWGETSHCTFCGLNSLGMGYRRKSPELVLDELKELSRRYNHLYFFAVDNILDHRYITEVFDKLRSQELDYEFWYEVKANLKPEQIRDLARSGLTWVQPGIESLNSNVLHLMRKGSSSLINLRFLKWAQYYGMRVAWNVLYGFPGETEQDYETQRALIERVPHLVPPDDHGRIRMDRFSPYHAAPETWGLTDVHPDPRYAAIFPATVDPGSIAYYFQFENPTMLADQVYAPMISAIEAWQRIWKEPDPPYLIYSRGAGQIRFDDGRQRDKPTHHFFGPLVSAAYPFLGRNQCSPGQIQDHLRTSGMAPTAKAVDMMLDDLDAAGLIWREEGVVLGLAIPASHRF